MGYFLLVLLVLIQTLSIIPEILPHEQNSVNRRMNTSLGAEKKLNLTHRNSADSNIKYKYFDKNITDSQILDYISLYRTVNDLRITKCKWLKYGKNLPTASVIIPFYNEKLSLLLAAVHSLIFRSPPTLLKEIILVDDDSTKENLGQHLDKYISKHFQIVRILRKKKREGIMKSRLYGARFATGTVLIFMDSRCKVGINWLPPLLKPIKKNNKTVTCPFIDIIKHDNFTLHPQDEGARGAFDWDFNYKRLSRFPEDEFFPEQPFDNPIMQGKIFAISRSWFWELGGYDEGLKMWGGEQFELSFKIWMCGGRMVDVPCSRIGCSFKNVEYVDFLRTNDSINKNYKRIAEVWMDNWKKFIYERRLEEFTSNDCGDISKQKKLRQDLNCKSFDWFMKNIAFDILYLYPPRNVVEIYNCTINLESDLSLCIDAKYGKQGDHIKVTKCVPNNKEQRFTFTSDMEIRPGLRDICFDYENFTESLVLNVCNKKNNNQKWEFDTDSHQVINNKSRKCIKLNTKNMELVISSCSPTQLHKWILKDLLKQKEMKRALTEINYRGNS